MPANSLCCVSQDACVDLGTITNKQRQSCLQFLCLSLAGGLNGSLGVGCSQPNCGTLNTAVSSTIPGAKCLNGLDPVSGFSDGLSYCCPGADECIAHGQSAILGPTSGLTVPVCLKGSPDTVELCRRENDNLLPTIQVNRAGATA